jgi:hypothetical protein
MNMRKALQITAVVAVLSACAPMSGGYSDPLSRLRNDSMATVDFIANELVEFLATGTENQAIEKAKIIVADSLKDPSSAQFRNVRIADYQNKKVICGEVNGKNSYGGYAGFSLFVSGISLASIYSSESRYADIERASNAGLIAACG